MPPACGSAAWKLSSPKKLLLFIFSGRDLVNLVTSRSFLRLVVRLVGVSSLVLRDLLPRMTGSI